MREMEGDTVGEMCATDGGAAAGRSGGGDANEDACAVGCFGVVALSGGSGGMAGLGGADTVVA